MGIPPPSGLFPITSVSQVPGYDGRRCHHRSALGRHESLRPNPCHNVSGVPTCARTHTEAILTSLSTHAHAATRNILCTSASWRTWTCALTTGSRTCTTPRRPCTSSVSGLPACTYTHARTQHTHTLIHTYTRTHACARARTGFGLSYTTFSFRWHNASAPPALTTTTAAAGAAHKAYYTSQGRAFEAPAYQVDVTNTGKVGGGKTGKAVRHSLNLSPLFFWQCVGSVVVLGFLTPGETGGAFVSKLFGYERVADLKPGETVTVTLLVAPQVPLLSLLYFPLLLAPWFPLSFQVLASADAAGQMGVREAQYAVNFGTSSDESAAVGGALRVTGKDVWV